MIIFGEHQNFLRVLFRKVINPTLVHTRKGIIDGWSRWSEPMVGDHENYFLTIFFSVGGGLQQSSSSTTSDPQKKINFQIHRENTVNWKNDLIFSYALLQKNHWRTQRPSEKEINAFHILSLSGIVKFHHIWHTHKKRDTQFSHFWQHTTVNPLRTCRSGSMIPIPGKKGKISN